jgi:hypothetical protein
MTQPFVHKIRSILVSALILALPATHLAQDLLPPLTPWKGKSLDLIVKKDNPWITPTEVSDFKTTPSYAETMAWLTKLCNSAPQIMRMVPVGKSAQYRDINMVIASSETFDKDVLKTSQKPLLLIQAGIHAGEIDGKDAGMMLLRDIAFGNKKALLTNCNILFIPILSVDGHERVSPYNRVNQRGPENMGWRTNARNLNLNRDYSKLDTEEIKAVVQVMNEYEPDLYLDLHVTDGADYQYDITFGISEGFSPSTSQWLNSILTPAVNKELKQFGHIPGPLVFAANDLDFRDGMVEYPYSIRFSTGYGDVRHIATILLENHSLKPFKQRVLGTYVFLESIIRTVSTQATALQGAISQDRARRNKEVVLTWKQSEKKDSIRFLGIESTREKSKVSNGEYVIWKGKPVSQTISFTRHNTPDKKSERPKAYWVPATHKEVIDRLRAHGLIMEVITIAEEIDVTMYRATNYKFAKAPNEGHFAVTADFKREKRREIFYPGSVKIETDQPLGDLAIMLLHPDSPDSFFQWGFFPEIFSRTEYIENYVIEPLANKMLAEDPALAAEFEKKKKEDPAFVNDAGAVYQWFYSRSPYFDSRWLLYPVGEE